MSTAPAPTPVATGPKEPEQVTVISHSNLFYWWPVWAVGFLMALLTWIDGGLMATVPPGTMAVKKVTVTVDDNDKLTEGKGTRVEREAYILPKIKDDKLTHQRVTRVDPKDPSSEVVHPRIHLARNKSYGVIFCITLLLVIVITNVPLRGMWSVVVIITLVLLSIIFALAGWWERILNALWLLDIRINVGGYLFISVTLLGIWLVVVYFFDKQVYMVFTPGQFKVCTEIGGGEKVYDTIGLTLERQRSDLFRHLILGLGSGDLIVKTTGAQSHHFDLPNVLFIGKKVQQIEDLLRKQKVLETKG